MGTDRFKAAVVGLGNIGFQLNLDPKRKETWSHVAAYESSRRIQLAGAVEIDGEKIRLFRQKYRDVPVYESIRDLMDHIPIDIISICTATPSHYECLKALDEHPARVKAIFCEKPLSFDTDEAREMVLSCRDRGIVLAVNHTRRWDNRYLSVKEMIRDGKIGGVKAVHACYSGQIFNIGTHLLDAVRMLIQKDPETVSGISFHPEKHEPNVSGWIRFCDETSCTVISTGKREDLIFEIDIIGSEGRIKLIENGEKTEMFSFIPSPRYSGYRELSFAPMVPVPKNDRFVDAVDNMIDVIEGRKEAVNCTGEDGFYSLSMCSAMLESARRNGEPVRPGTLGLQPCL